MRRSRRGHEVTCSLEGGRTLTPVGAAPQVSDDLVDLVHLHAVEFHDGSETKNNPNTQNQSRRRCVMLDWTEAGSIGGWGDVLLSYTLGMNINNQQILAAFKTVLSDTSNWKVAAEGCLLA